LAHSLDDPELLSASAVFSKPEWQMQILQDMKAITALFSVFVVVGQMVG
jgi:hypothetical protein